MERTTLERAVEVVRALTPGEQQQLRQMMDTWEPPKEAETTPKRQRRLAEHLRARGVIAALPPRYRVGYHSADAADRHPPIAVKGQPVSETLLEDREPH